MHSVVRPRPTLKPPTGAADFLEGLEDSNVPQDLMTNAKNIKKKLKVPTSKRKRTRARASPTPTPSRDQSPEYFTPSREAQGAEKFPELVRKSRVRGVVSEDETLSPRFDVSKWQTIKSAKKKWAKALKSTP